MSLPVPPPAPPPPTQPTTSASPAPPHDQPNAPRVDIRQRSPLPLTAAQEAQVRELYYKRVRQKCADEIRDFAHCCAGRTVSITWACRAQRLAMNGCMVAAATREEEDAAREEWFRGLPERRRDAEEADALAAA